TRATSAWKKTSCFRAPPRCWTPVRCRQWVMSFAAAGRETATPALFPDRFVGAPDLDFEIWETTTPWKKIMTANPSEPEPVPQRHRGLPRLIPVEPSDGDGVVGQYAMVRHVQDLAGNVQVLTQVMA